jgi:hypothetical protein
MTANKALPRTGSGRTTAACAAASPRSPLRLIVRKALPFNIRGAFLGLLPETMKSATLTAFLVLAAAQVNAGDPTQAKDRLPSSVADAPNNPAAGAAPIERGVNHALPTADRELEARFLERVGRALSSRDENAVADLFCFDGVDEEARRRTMERTIPDLLRHEYLGASLRDVFPEMADAYSVRIDNEETVYEPNMQPYKTLIIEMRNADTGEIVRKASLVGTKNGDLGISKFAKSSNPAARPAPLRRFAVPDVPTYMLPRTLPTGPPALYKGGDTTIPPPQELIDRVQRDVQSNPPSTPIIIDVGTDSQGGRGAFVNGRPYDLPGIRERLKDWLEKFGRTDPVLIRLTDIKDFTLAATIAVMASETHDSVGLYIPALNPERPGISLRFHPQLSPVADPQDMPDLVPSAPIILGLSETHQDSVLFHGRYLSIAETEALLRQKASKFGPDDPVILVVSDQIPADTASAWLERARKICRNVWTIPRSSAPEGPASPFAPKPIDDYHMACLLLMAFEQAIAAKFPPTDQGTLPSVIPSPSRLDLTIPPPQELIDRVQREIQTERAAGATRPASPEPSPQPTPTNQQPQ